MPQFCVTKVPNLVRSRKSDLPNIWNYSRLPEYLQCSQTNTITHITN